MGHVRAPRRGGDEPIPAVTNRKPTVQLRIVKIYTRTGDTGDTALFDGTRVRKSDRRVDAYGHIDELNATLGLARASCADPVIISRLEQLQRDLFALGARLADPAARIAGRVTKAA